MFKTNPVNPKIKLASSAGLIIFLIVVAKMPRFPWEEPTINDVIVWSATMGWSLGMATKALWDLVTNKIN